MPKVSQEQYYNGAVSRMTRLGLGRLWAEVLDVLTGFQLLLLEEHDANGAAAVRQLIDARFDERGGWEKLVSGGVDWTKCAAVNGVRSCIGVEVQVSNRSDMLIVDVVHLRDSIVNGDIDVGAIVVPADATAPFLTDRAPRYRDATRAVERARAEDLPLIVLGLGHDGPGPPLAKRRTRQGRG